eukprot:TRINITY_DN39948_c0_g2_i1.p1 TRINITY_DN39948_c0_g2~~TRINITY_DN39948_c0_g2_i1.p1  ORF type:complete len:439 (-),score=93.23 TRINITY_DN39948_c0_g2_i1:279-1595(-)
MSWTCSRPCGCKEACSEEGDASGVLQVDGNAPVRPTTALDEDAPLEERGEVELKDGSRYSGQWQGSQPCGQGRLWRPDSSCYEGYFVAGKAHGHGKFFTADGHCYEGQWMRDKAHGRGRYIYADGSSYNGEWFNDYKSGHGVQRWLDGSVYTGAFVAGKKHGLGTYSNAEGQVVYSGEFLDDKMDGNGVYNFSDGRRYKGDWKQGFRHGLGVMTWPTGQSYCGEWKAGKQDGKGTSIGERGCVRKAVWKDGKEIAVSQWLKGHHRQDTGSTDVDSQAKAEDRTGSSPGANDNGGVVHGASPGAASSMPLALPLPHVGADLREIVLKQLSGGAGSPDSREASASPGSRLSPSPPSSPRTAVNGAHGFPRRSDEDRRPPPDPPPEVSKGNAPTYSSTAARAAAKARLSRFEADAAADQAAADESDEHVVQTPEPQKQVPA